LKLDPTLIIKYKDHSNEGIKYAREFISNRNYTAAIIVGYDFVTKYVSELLNNGLIIPDELSIINYKASANFNDETGLLMTCMVQPLAEMGKAAVDLLFNKNNIHERYILFNPIFIKGQTISTIKNVAIQKI
ncbi:MAG TPA: substrate-binding domain-containing protein, partial [Victivallales bacterium]|nr:substrate-binding domain-containing protein [Victivallales bacterium]